MAKTKETPKNIILTRKTASFDNLVEKRKLWDQMEELNHGMLTDAISDSTKSKVFDHRLSTLNDERSNRVMAQLPTGKVVNTSKNDKGGSLLLDLLLEKYVYPKANAQFPFLTKLRMINNDSGPFASAFALVDWDVKPNGYVGPDMWMIDIRNVFPQVGAASLEDSDYIIIRTWQPLSYFEALLENNADKKGKSKNGYKNLKKIIDKLSGKSGSKNSRDSENMSKREEDQYPQADVSPGDGYFECLHQFEKDTWTDYCVDADEEYRQVDNPHENSELPIVQKHSIPSLVDFMGTSKFQRGASMQETQNSVWNLYLDAVKMSIFPPLLINKDNIASMSTIKYVPAGKWLVRNQVSNAVQAVNISPKGIETFQNTHQSANASLINLFGTSDTTIARGDDPSQGKTPQALKMQAARENTGDNADRFFMEQFLSQVIKKMVNLLAKKQSSSISVRMFEDEIIELAAEYPDVAEMYNPQTGKLTINKGKGGEMKYDYNIVEGSTYALNEEQQAKSLDGYIQLYMKFQTPEGNLLGTALEKEGMTFKLGEAFKKGIMNSGIKDPNSVFSEISEKEKAEKILMADAQKLKDAMNPPEGQLPPKPGQGQQPPNINAIPPQQ
jgi:hypothetical protein